MSEPLPEIPTTDPQVIATYIANDDTKLPDENAPFSINNMKKIAPGITGSPELIPRQIGMFKDRPKNLFIITRNKNDNIIAYAAHPGNGMKIEAIAETGGIDIDWISTGLDMKNPIDPFWQDMHRKGFLEETRETPLRSELIWIEKKMSYGIDTSEVTPHSCFLKLKAVPSRRIQVKIEQNPDGSSRPVGIVKLNGVDCYLIRIYVEAIEKMFGYPSVQWINMHGVSIEDGREIVEKLKP